jgi:hypothetical protein
VVPGFCVNDEKEKGVTDKQLAVESGRFSARSGRPAMISAPQILNERRVEEYRAAEALLHRSTGVQKLVGAKP